MLCLVFVLSQGCGLAVAFDEPALSRHDFTRLMMGARARVTIYAESRAVAEPAAVAAFARLALLEDVMSDYRPTSELSRIIAESRGEPIPITSHMTEVLSLALDMARITNGAYDPTVGPLVALWRESRKTKKLPDPALLEAAKASTGWARVELVIPETGAATVRIPPGMTLDFGGIGKGYAAGHVRDMLRDMGFTRTLIAIGGDIAVGDPPPEAEGWRIAVDMGAARPAHAGDGSQRIVDVANTCISTSGSSEQFVTIGGVDYSHIVDPRTGLGVTHLAAATVMHPKPGVSDALATAMCILGADDAAKMVAREFPQAEFLIEAASNTGFSRISSRRFTFDDPAPVRAEPPPGFVALFNGESLAGWRGLAADPPEFARMNERERADAQARADERVRRHWRVIDGLLHFDGGDGPNLQTMNEYGDCELILDWRIGKDGDSGIYLRGVPQVQIWDNPIGSGGLYNNSRHPSNPLAHADTPVGMWNRFHIVMHGDRVTVRLNDVLVVDDVPLENYWNRREPLPERGPIELQAHGTPLWFTNILIKPLD